MDITQLMKSGARFQTLSTGIAGILLLVLIVHSLASVSHSVSVAALAASLIVNLPLVLYLFVVLKARQAFGLLAKGDQFVSVIPTLLRHMAVMAILAGGFRIFGQAILLRWIAPERFSAYLTFDAAALASIVMGILLILIARLFSTVADMRRELYEIV